MANTALLLEHMLWKRTVATNFLDRSVRRRDELQAIKRAFQAAAPSQQRRGVCVIQTHLTPL